MASLTVSTPCKISAASSLAGRKAASKPAGVGAAICMNNTAAAATTVTTKVNISVEAEKSAEKREAMQRRSAIFMAAAALAAAASGMAMAEEPRPGSPEAKKIYKRICVTMPTARVCHY